MGQRRTQCRGDDDQTLQKRQGKEVYACVFTLKKKIIDSLNHTTDNCSSLDRLLLNCQIKVQVVNMVAS